MGLAPTDPLEQWDHYIGWADGAPASITLNFWYADGAPFSGVDGLYVVTVPMVEPGPEGLGTATEAEGFGAIDQRIADWTRAAGLFYVARIRAHGAWQLTFYGRDGAERSIETFVNSQLAQSGWRPSFASNRNPGWDYYLGTVCPTPERWQWMKNRRVVDALVDAGDSLNRPRRVDHWAYFDTPIARDAYARAATNAGFSAEPAGPPDEEATRPFGANVHRLDAVRLDDIHLVVMQLVELAATHGGDYDGWETSVESD